MNLASATDTERDTPFLSSASEVVRSGLRLLEDREQKMAALRSAIEKGLNSGIEEDFDSQEFLLQMKERKHGNI